MIKEEKRYAQSGVFEGIVSLRTLFDVIKSNGINDRKINKVIYDKDKVKTDAKEYSWLLHRAEEFSFEIQLSDREEIDEITVGNTHGGIVAICSERNIPVFDDLSVQKCGDFTVMLDGIEDPYNFGYALRSLYAAGASSVLLRERNWMSAAGVVCRASAGASELLPMFTVSDSESMILSLKSKKYKIVCADLRNSVPLYDSDLKKPLLLIVGGEKRGISRLVLDMSDVNVRIDYGRDFGASLSAASAATVVGFEVYRQNID